MPNYRVSWEIDIFDAADPRDAARQAFDIQQRPRAQILPDDAVVFTVIEHESDGDAVTVDLAECDCAEPSGDSDVCTECGRGRRSNA